MILTATPRFALDVPKAPPRDRTGFTLVELLLVVMVLGIMAGVAVPKYQAAMDGVALEAAAKRLAADVRHTRQEAIRRGQELGLDFDPVTDSYTSPPIGGQSVADLEHPSQGLSVTLDSRVAIASTGYPSDRLRFDFRGDPSAIGSVNLTNGSVTVSVVVNGAGEVEVVP